MATHPYFRDDPYQQTCEAVITAITEAGAVTDATVFYPAGGGQPGDQGEITTADGRCVAVTDTRAGSEGAIVHCLDAGHGLAAGARVTLRLDWPRRYAHMRMHTALHLLSVAVPAGVTGGQIGAERARLDFDLPDNPYDRETLSAALNERVEQDHPVTTEWLSEAELDAHPDLVKTMAVAPPRGVGDIRMVRIGAIDYQPCGGTHVASTAEIGPIEVAGIKNRGAKNRRFTLTWPGGEP